MKTRCLVLSVLALTAISCANKSPRTPASTDRNAAHCQVAAQKLIHDWFKGQMAVGCEVRGVTPSEPYMIEDYSCSVQGTGMNTNMNARMKFDTVTRECMAISNR